MGELLAGDPFIEMSIGRSVLDASVLCETTCFAENGGTLVHDPLSVLAQQFFTLHLKLFLCVSDVT